MRIALAAGVFFCGARALLEVPITKTLYVTGLTPQAGKSALCAGIGSCLQTEGLRVGYLRPISEHPGAEARKDAEFFKELFTLPASVEALTPSASPDSWTEALRLLEQERDITLIEAEVPLPGLVAQGDLLTRLRAQTDAQMLLIARYSRALTAERLQRLAQQIGESTRGGLGVVINAVPAKVIGWVRESLVPTLENAGLKVWGVLPLETLLLSITIGELATTLKGHILNDEEKADQLIENFLLGARSWDPASPYVQRKRGFAFITRGDLEDVLHAAMVETTRCMVMTGGVSPSMAIRYRAEEAGIPLIVVEQDTVAAVKELDRVLPEVRFRHPQKVAKLSEILTNDPRLNGLLALLRNGQAA